MNDRDLRRLVWWGVFVWYLAAVVAILLAVAK
jgi:hypothetical protein